MNAKSHFLRYGTAAEQKYMIQYQHTFDGIVINGSMLAHISKSLSAFVHNKIKKTFFIDPMTHAFQHDLEKIQNKEGNIKASIKKLAKSYGAPIDIILNEVRPIKKEDFNSANLPGFVFRVLQFQNQHLTDHLEDEYKSYVEYSKIDRTPDFLIAPYFYLTLENLGDWNKLNQDLIRISLDCKSNFSEKKIYAQLVIDKELLLNSEKCNDLIRQYSIADGLVYWIDGLSEIEASERELKALKELVNYYKELNPAKQIISLYGGYFSQLLLKDGLDGVVHGLEYGENREVVPVGGGIPISKFYLPDLKKRLPAAVMITILRLLQITTPEKYQQTICACHICQETITTDVTKDFYQFIKNKPSPKIIKTKKGTREIFYPERESKELCLFHYLECKNSEFKKVKKTSKKVLIDELQDAYTKFSRYLDKSELAHLTRWYNVLNA